MNILQSMWTICLRKKKEGTLLVDRKTPFILVPNPKWAWAADPFIYEKNKVLYIFAELYGHKKGKGVIGCCKFDGKNFSEWETVLDLPYHLSYPYIFENNDHIYMMPETGAAKEIAIFRAKNFPGQWIKESVIFSGEQLVDSTFVNDDLMVCYHPEEDHESVVLLTKTIENQYEISEKIEDKQKLLRPAGKIFFDKEQCMIPLQDCSKIYGGGLHFAYFSDKKPYFGESILHLSAEDIPLMEKLMFAEGIHTYNSSLNYEVVDIRYKRLSISYLIRGLWRKITHAK